MKSNRKNFFFCFQTILTVKSFGFISGKKRDKCSHRFSCSTLLEQCQLIVFLYYYYLKFDVIITEIRFKSSLVKLFYLLTV